jgi:hypothetical protein
MAKDDLHRSTIRFNPELAKDLLRTALREQSWLTSQGQVRGYSVDDDGTLRVEILGLVLIDKSGR